MKKAYVLQDENRYVIGVTLELQKASEMCYENKGWSYRMVDFYCGDGTEISMTAGPIRKEFLPSENQQPKLSELKTGDHLLCVKDFETGTISKGVLSPDFLKDKSYEIYGIMKSGEYVSVSFINENGTKHCLTTAFLKRYFGLTDRPERPVNPSSKPS